MKRITIDPITRLEGHGKIEIFLNEEGDVENTYLQIPELRGFEQFCVGRPAEEMPRITNRICGVCPEAHHMAGTKALDALFHVEPSSAVAYAAYQKQFEESRKSYRNQKVLIVLTGSGLKVQLKNQKM